MQQSAGRNRNGSRPTMSDKPAGSALFEVVAWAALFSAAVFSFSSVYALGVRAYHRTLIAGGAFVPR